jgi:hypothetical protein
VLSPSAIATGLFESRDLTTDLVKQRLCHISQTKEKESLIQADS